MTEEPPANAALVSRNAGTDGTRYALEAGELIIGRAQDAGLVLDSLSVSRRHARVWSSGSAYELEDLGSKNGTWLNEVRLTEPASLSDGDVIRFGDLVFVLSFDTSATMTLEWKAPSSLATILFTDMESSTALTQKLGDAAAQALVHTHNAVVRDALKLHGGREIKHTGDGIMASFQSASGALACAVDIQEALAALDEPNGGSVHVRIGVNAGEPVREDDDLFGTSVQLAKRICDHARPGQILAADVVRQLAAGKDFLFSDLGETALRGFEDPVKLWDLRWNER